MTMHEQLETIARQVRGCVACPLHRGRANAVPGSGDPASTSCILVGEGPGAEEDQQGLPFSGASGHLLDALLCSAGITREVIFLTNVIKCRAPGNRDPEPAELAACRQHLDRQIEAVNPKLIIAMGLPATRHFFPDHPPAELRGQAYRLGERTVIPVWHPAAALRRTSWRDELVDQFQLIGDLLAGDPVELAELPAARRRAPETPVPTAGLL